jgi:hypothetical protein
MCAAKALKNSNLQNSPEGEEEDEEIFSHFSGDGIGPLVLGNGL